MPETPPLCSCHGEPMWRMGRGYWGCATKERARNAERIRVGGEDVFVGRAHQFGTTKQVVKQFISNLRREHHAESQ